MITASIVTYNHCLKEIEPVLKSLLSSPVSRIFVIDHSNVYKGLGKELKDYPNVEYIVHENNGYGGGHNVGLRKAQEMGMKYHLVVNPDIWFDEKVLPALIDYMEHNEDVGQMMPKVLFPDGSNQRLVKLLPTPIDMFGRFFLLRSYLKRNIKFELQESHYEMILNAPYLSGCFMLFRMEAIEKVNFFDEHLFMYAEDIDITRRIHEHYKTIFYPKVEIYHKFSRASHSNFRLFWIHFTNIIMYFNKWGWWVDEKRDRFNNEVLDDIQRQLKNK